MKAGLVPMAELVWVLFPEGERIERVKGHLQPGRAPPGAWLHKAVKLGKDVLCRARWEEELKPVMQGVERARHDHVDVVAKAAPRAPQANGGGVHGRCRGDGLECVSLWRP